MRTKSDLINNLKTVFAAEESSNSLSGKFSSENEFYITGKNAMFFSDSGSSGTNSLKGKITGSVDKVIIDVIVNPVPRIYLETFAPLLFGLVYLCDILSPEGLHKNPAYSQVAIVEGNCRTIYIGGQNAVDKEGKVVGKGDIQAQAKQVLENLEIALKAGGGAIENIIKWNVYLLQGQSAEKALQMFQGAMSKMKNPPLITGVFVAGLAGPDFLLEMEAIAVVQIKN